MKNGGFTLIEIIISILIIGVISVTILPMFFQGFRTVFSSASKTEAINITRSELISDLRTAGTASVDVKFKNTDNSLITTVSAIHYLPKEPYILPNKGEETLKLDYYTYPD